MNFKNQLNFFIILLILINLIQKSYNLPIVESQADTFNQTIEYDQIEPYGQRDTYNQTSNSNLLASNEKLSFTLCINDADCPQLNCVLFFCKPQGCRSDADCTNWGYKNYFCLNKHHTFIGTQCIQKHISGQLCNDNNDCLSGRCNIIFCA